MKRAAVLALLIAASTTLTPAAHAAGSVTAQCTEGGFSGEFDLTYDRIAGGHRLKKGRGGAGPYIGDYTGSMNVKVNYRDRETTNNVLNRTKSGLESDEIAEVPVEGTRVPSTTRAWVEVRFSDSSGVRCTARKNLV